MSLKTKIKSLPFIRNLGKKINIWYAFNHDTRDFSKHYVEEAEKNGDYRYSIMLLVHSLEKGMCMPNPRPFGNDKVRELMTFLNKYSNKQEFEYKLGISILHSWRTFFDEHGWEAEHIYKEVAEFLKTHTVNDVESGRKNYIYNPQYASSNEFEKMIFSRHSVRDFQDRPLDMVDVDLAIRCFIETPTACNRQMCRLIYVKNPEVKAVLDKIIIGIPGFNKETVQYFLVTYDLAAFAYSGERQQGLFNAGLCTMNFVNGLHAKGIGSCCLQWSNKYAEDAMVRKTLGIRDSERIGIVVGCGYYLENNLIPCSTRRSKEDVFRIV